ncbi:MAG TPA: DUF4287 domain-containing protein [Candidatus Limnocylindria bacterium]|nr:DUF4287 domain-containing protein [Candidatus Limnocylindria bacterium]
MPSRHAADIRQVAQKTGRTLEEWSELLEANGIGDRREAVNFLRDYHAVSHAFALAIANHCLRRSDDDEWSEYGGGDYDENEPW